ncbi:MAG: ribonuclease III [Clostridia bacterium]|nr:ribonuclease III [Clostridia bacterium]
MAFPYAEIEKKIGYTFRNKSLLEQAFRHSTYANARGGEDNERMEYLGDAVLQLAITEWQYTGKTDGEGKMTRERQKIVCEKGLLHAVENLGIEQYLLFEGSKENVGKKTLSSLFETVVAAIFLDGGYAPAKKFVLKKAILSAGETTKNYKGALQEFVQARNETRPIYQTNKTGKDNDPWFVAKVTALGKSATGQGKSKREAEQRSAKELLEILRKPTR